MAAQTGTIEQIAEVNISAKQAPIKTYTTPSTIALDTKILEANTEKRQDKSCVKKNKNPLT